MGGGIGAGSKKRRIGMITEINVTPLVDIMLVLLIIFMLTADVVSRRKALELELPQAVDAVGIEKSPLVVTITKTGELYIDGAQVDEGGLARKVVTTLATAPEAQAVIAADKDTAHGRVVWVMSAVKSLGMSAFAIEIDPDKMLAPPVPGLPKGGLP